MPEVFVKAKLKCGKREIFEDLLLNSGARGADLVIPKRTARKLKLRAAGETEVYFGRLLKGKVGKVEVCVENPTTGERRIRTLEAIVLSDRVLDCALLGVEGQEKLGVIPDTRVGKPIF